MRIKTLYVHRETEDEAMDIFSRGIEGWKPIRLIGASSLSMEWRLETAPPSPFREWKLEVECEEGEWDADWVRENVRFTGEHQPFCLDAYVIAPGYESHNRQLDYRRVGI